MDRLQGRKRKGRGQVEACTNEPQKSACAHWPGAEKTYLQRLNKTSLCQTIQGMAGHSLCGVEGGGVRREVRQGGGGRRGMKERRVGEKEGGRREGQQRESYMAGLSHVIVRRNVEADTGGMNEGQRAAASQDTCHHMGVLGLFSG